MNRADSAILRWRKPVYIFLGILALAMFIMSLVQAWVLVSVPDLPAYGSIPTYGGLPRDDERGAFLMLNSGHNSKYSGNLIKLLSVSEAGVVDTQSAAHLKPQELQSVLVQSANISRETNDYRVTLIGDTSAYQMSYTRQPGGKQLLIQPEDRQWRPGAYQIDVPSEGMFGGRDYYQFYIDAGQNFP